MKKVVVVGAGPGGIVATKEILERGIDDVVCLESSQALGGVFSRSYENLLLTSSAVFSMFSDHWVGDGNEHHFWTKKEAVQYWTNYAEEFGVSEKIKFGSTVASAKLINGCYWELETCAGEQYRCEHLIIAIGNNNIPKYPEWMSELTSVASSHSKDYFNAKSFADKRVLVVGGGESASDIAFEVSKVSEKTWVSLREATGWVVPRKRNGRAADMSTHRGVWNLPRDYGGKISQAVLDFERKAQDPVSDAVVQLNNRLKAKKGMFGTYGTKTLALPLAMANHGCSVVDGVDQVRKGGRELVTTSGEVLEDIDCVVFCTGYTNSVSFLTDEICIETPRELYKHIFHPQTREKLAFIGWARPGFGSQFPIMEMQARLCSHVVSGDINLPSNGEMEKTAKEDKAVYLAQFEGNAKHINSLVDYHRYMDSIGDMLNCVPPFWKYFLLRPNLWMRLVYGPTQATQFRLRGLGSKPEKAIQILRKIPVSGLNHIVKAGIRGRFRYMFRR